MLRKKLAVLFAAAMVAATVAGCGGGDTPAEPAPKEEAAAPAETAPAEDTAADTAAAGGTISVGYAQVGHESDWRTANTQNYQNTFTAENGYELQLVDCDNDNAAWVGTNTKNEGVTAGNWLAEYLDGKEANILVIEGTVGASAALGRSEGFNEVAASHSEWKILDSQSGDFTQAGGQEVMESFIKSYEGQFNVVVCHNDNEAYGAMDAMDAAGITYGVGGDVILISFDATHDGLQYTLDGKINCNVECNPIQAEVVASVIQAMNSGSAYEATTLVNDEAFVAPGITSQYATTMTEEILAGRAY